MLDALTFWVNGFKNVTCLFGTEGFTDELWEALKNVQRVRIAYDADDAGERAAQRDTERFQKHGIEVFRVKFPHGMDANEYACKVKPADKSLALLMNCGAMGAAHGAPASTAARATQARCDGGGRIHRRAVAHRGQGVAGNRRGLGAGAVCSRPLRGGAGAVFFISCFC